MTKPKKNKRLNVELERMRAALSEIEQFTVDVPDDHPLSHVHAVAHAALQPQT